MPPRLIRACFYRGYRYGVTAPGFHIVSRRQADTVAILTASDQHRSPKKLRVHVVTQRVIGEVFCELCLMNLLDLDGSSWRATRRIGETLGPFLSNSMCRSLSLACRRFSYDEMDARGAGEAARIGDRFWNDTQKVLYVWLRENLVEGLRSGIQTSFYTCDYTTKPSLTCGPVLKHLTTGMQRLEERMQVEAEAAECQRLLDTYPLPAQSQAKTPRATPEQQEARKRLRRLWTAANHAVMHGHCLMAIQLLTGREVIRTHVFWRLMLKRVLWGIFEEMRRCTEDETQQVGLSDVAFTVDAASRGEVPEVSGARKLGSRGEVPEVSGARKLGQSSAENVELRTTSFYEDYLHRGDVEPLAAMNFYVYGMHVSCAHVSRTSGTDFAEFEFEPHYSKAKQYVQVLHAAPRVPYLHGVSMPTKLRDGEMWAAVHCALLRKHRCDSAHHCGRAQAVKHIRKIPVSPRKRVLVQGGDARALLDKTGILGEWRATEAETQTLAARADVPRT